MSSEESVTRLSDEGNANIRQRDSGHFYEKVVKVKADVAAIHKFFLQTPQIEADHHDAAPVVRIGGMRKGGFSRAIMAAGATTAL